MKSTVRMKTFFDRMSWTYGIATTRGIHPDMRISEVVKMADVLGAPRGPFLSMYAEYLCGPPQVTLPRLAHRSPLPEAEVVLIRKAGAPTKAEKARAAK